MTLLRTTSLAIALLPLLVGCYPIEKFYSTSYEYLDGKVSLEVISRIKLDEATNTGVFLYYQKRPFRDEEIFTAGSEVLKAEKGGVVELRRIYPLTDCLIIDELNWRCKMAGGRLFQMLDGELFEPQGGTRWHSQYKITF